ncbi:MAG: hypothetical protein HYX28_08635 [Candidatus Koribacter versatilis]|uniref:Uncharacterized protein n=1 Tax=Candidatus Korobacter versatilis TaxID=658062 RepID=A0A932AAT7_9BACT|nr:hypothetical protein [Candidatus Koribacter versatilis]
MTPTDQNTDNDLKKGAMEDETRDEKPMTSMAGQLGHRDQDPLLKSNDTDFPEPGESPEHNGQLKEPNHKEEDTRFDPRCNLEGVSRAQEPNGEQKKNRGGKKDDELAA